MWRMTRKNWCPRRGGLRDAQLRQDGQVGAAVIPETESRKTVESLSIFSHAASTAANLRWLRAVSRQLWSYRRDRLLTSRRILHRTTLHEGKKVSHVSVPHENCEPTL